MEKTQENENLEINTKLEEKKIEYVPAGFVSRIFANLLDFLILLFLTISIFIGARAIVSSTEKYQAKDQELLSLKLNSGLFDYDKNNVLMETTYFLDTAPEQTAESRMILGRKTIEKFLNFANEKCDESQYLIILNDYNEFRISDSMKIDGVSMFVNNDGNIIENEELLNGESGGKNAIYKSYYEDCYKPYINNHLQSFLNTKIPGYFDLNKYMSNVLTFAEILPSFLLGFIITYLVPGFIFKRGRCTFGKRAYRIALVDSDCLSPKVLTFVFRTFVLLLEFILAIPSFGATLLISFSLMAFSKKKQGVPDYMLNLREIRMNTNKIYMNFDEADLDNIDTHKEPINFKTKNYD